jgi:hypothetical protein
MDTPIATREEIITPDGKTEYKITPAPEALAPEKREYISAEELFDVDDVLTDDVYIEAWGKWVTIRQLTLQDEYEIRKAAVVGDELLEELVDAGLIAKSLVNPAIPFDRAPIFLTKNRRAAGDLLRAINRIARRTERGVEGLEATFPQAAE